jgi:hypothetical protein
MFQKLINIESLLRIFLETTIKKALQFWRNVLWILGRFCGLSYSQKHLDPGFIRPGRLTSDKLVNSASETPNISISVVASLFDNFRCHIKWSATDRQ